MVMGGLLILAARSNLGLVLVVAVEALAISGFASWLGRRVGVVIDRRGFLPALGLEALSGLASLGGAALCAEALGLMRAGYDGLSDSYLSTRRNSTDPALMIAPYRPLRSQGG